MKNYRFLKLLAREYPTVEAVSSEIINLNAIKCLPKGTEYFFSDLHGEYEAFLHLLKSASGIIHTKIEYVFNNSMSDVEMNMLANLIYYPEKTIEHLKLDGKALDDWRKINIYRLVLICKEVSSKYTRSKVRKKMPVEFSYIIDELLHADYGEGNKKYYYNEIVHSIIEIGTAEKFIKALCTLIQDLSVDNLHIIGDIYDRGSRADIIIDELMNFHDVDIQWGNHDISWMGAAAGSYACMANVIRIGMSYSNFDLLEDGYGINLRSLSMFAAEQYKDDLCKGFTPHIFDENKYDAVDTSLVAKMHKAIAIIQFKLEGQLILRHPEYYMEDRLLLDKMDFKKGTIEVEGKEYFLNDDLFPTVAKENPYILTEGEKELMNSIAASFVHSKILHRHIKFLYSHGSMYKIVNSNLLFHGCIPMGEDGEFLGLEFEGKKYTGKGLMDCIDKQVHNAYFLSDQSKEKEAALDFMWYLWCGSRSPLFGKSKLSAFEHCFIDEKETHKETYNTYYRFSEEEAFCIKILKEFGLHQSNAHIINGHVPVRLSKGECPVKANGKLFVIDGGISKAYQSRTGIAGYTLIYNSRHLALAEHKPFQSGESSGLQCNTPKVKIVEVMDQRVTVANTDIGKELDNKIEGLMELLDAYNEGIIKERI
jgi:fructose-1,6-bisphosphatase III